MALATSYATAAQYRARNEKSDTSDDAEILDQLTGASRLIEPELGYMLGGFNSHTGVYTFDAHGGSELYLRDRAGLAYPLQSIDADGLGIDSERDGTYDGYQLDTADAWVRGLPENSAALSMPFFSVELLPISTANPSNWPTAPGSVQITGTWGWAAVPGLITEMVIAIVRQMRDTHVGGAAMAFEMIDSGVRVTDERWRLWKRVQAQYSKKLPVVG